MAILTEKGQLGLQHPKEKTEFPWVEIWTHILEEFALRRMSLPADCIDLKTSPIPTAPNPAKGFIESRSIKGDLSNALVKYGNRHWLSTTLKTGNWQVSPASSYSDASLEAARQDSELEFSMQFPCFEETSVPVEGIEGSFHHDFKGAYTIQTRATTDYYLVSLARGLIYRMFDDFHADACLIIRDEDRFRKQMLKAFSCARPAWLSECRPVDYLDPCMPARITDVYFTKHFRYAYQEEFRFVWKPSCPVNVLPKICITLGSLEGICELLMLQ
jgi:hypothetical protein